MDYIWEKFHVAVMVLASGNGSIQERLTDAFTSGLTRLNIHTFPTKDSKSRYDALIAKATAVKPLSNEGSIAATFRSMSDEKCREIAEEIVTLYDGFAQSLALQKGRSNLE